MKNLFGKKENLQKEEVLLPKYTADPEKGLTDALVQERIQAGLVNVVNDQTSRTEKEIIFSNIFTYFNMIFFVLALILLTTGSFNNMTFLGVVCANTVIGIVQELKSKKELEKLQLVTEPETNVIRNGSAVRIPSDQLVRDDIIVLSAGNQICADGTVVSGEVMVNESLVTGESDEIRKQPGDALLSGSFVISGNARASLDRVGDACFAAQLAKNAKKIKKKQQPGMMHSLTMLIRIIGFIIIPFGVLMYYNQFHVLQLTHKVAVENTAAALIGMIPEGLYLLTTLALAASTLRLAKANTLVHDMKCIETLARVDVLCVDKTGTITEMTMQVKDILPFNSEETALRNKVGDFARSMNPDNETMKALQKAYPDNSGYRSAVRIKGFSSADKFSACDFGYGEAYVLGAPEFILKERDPELKKMIAEHASQGERVLLFASYEFTPDSEDDVFAKGKISSNVTPLGIVTLVNPIRPNAEKTFHYFTEQGVSIRVISGDNPMTAAMSAQKAGIPDAQNYIDLSTQKTEEEVKEAALKYTVFGRVTPEQKKILVLALKGAGHTVAMTGDGVNDVLALKDADCSIAMASGSEAAANVADLVLLDSDFSGMPAVVAEGRRVINNIERSASLYLMKNICSFLLSAMSLLFVSLYPMKPSQISLVSGVMIGIPSFILAMEPNEELVKGKFLRNVLTKAFPAAMTAVILVQWVLLFAYIFAIPADMASTTSFLIFAFVSYLMLFHVCRPMRPLHAVLFVSMGILFVAAARILPGWFQISALNGGCILVLVTSIVLAIPLDLIFQALIGIPDMVKKEKAWREARKPKESL